jgi:hypothetical protein
MSQAANREYFYSKCNQKLGSRWNIPTDNLAINVEWLCKAAKSVYTTIHAPKTGCRHVFSTTLITGPNVNSKQVVDKTLVDKVVTYLSNFNAVCDNDCDCPCTTSNCACASHCTCDRNCGGSSGDCTGSYNCYCNCACNCGSNTECECECDGYWNCNCTKVNNCDSKCAACGTNNCGSACNCQCDCACACDCACTGVCTCDCDYCLIGDDDSTCDCTCSGGDTCATTCSGDCHCDCDHDCSSCFITTAVCKAFNKPDDCEELIKLRHFRDTYMQTSPEMRADALEYYEVAPKICKAIDSLGKQSLSIYISIYNNYLKPCLNYIDTNDYRSTYNMYKKMVLDLKHIFIDRYYNG